MTTALRMEVRNHGQEIEREMEERLLKADEERSFINNTSFMAIHHEKYGYGRFRFFWHEDVVFVCNESHGIKFIVTVLNLAGTILARVKSRQKYKKKQPVH